MRLIKLRQLNFKHCEGYYSKNANACIFPCSISEMDREDQMLEIYEKVILWSDVVIVSTPIRWGNASSLYYQMVQRMNCVQNQSVTHNQYLIRDKAGCIYNYWRTGQYSTCCRRDVIVLVPTGICFR